MHIKHLADKLANMHETRDPFKLAKEMGVIVVHAPLIGVRGYYQCVHRCNIVYVSDNLDERQSRFVCAHELGHVVMHKGLNRIFLDTCTHMATGRFETEANRFAVCLLCSDDNIREASDHAMSYVTESLGVGYDLAEYRLSVFK